MGFRLRTLVYVRVSLLVSAAYFLLKAPEKLYTNFLFVGIGYVLTSNVGSGSEGWLGVLLLLLAIEDFMRLYGPRPTESFMNVLPARLLVLFVLFVLCYYFKINTLSTGPTFTFLFYDCLLSGWCFLAAREQINEDNKRIVRDSRGYAEEQL